MKNIIGIRREDKNIWERRVPLTPEQVHRLITEHNIEFVVQSSEIRIFKDEEYRSAGAEVGDDVSHCPVVLGIKEMPINFFRPEGTYAFFAHVIKGQPQNMPMLKRMMELRCSLIDYEKVTDDQGRRLIFFGRFAGIAGMVDTLAGLGKRLAVLGFPTPFVEVELAHKYGSVQLAKAAVGRIGERIRSEGLPKEVTPLVIGVTGYGNVARGVNEIFDTLMPVDVKPNDLPDLVKNGNNYAVYRVVFKEEDTVEPKTPGHGFNLQEYFAHPELYRSKFETYLNYLTVLVNCIYWNERYPRLVTKGFLKQIFLAGRPKLLIIGDISCDIEGSIEATVKVTNPGEPFFVYNPIQEKAVDGVEGEGVVIMAVDNLPCELARAASHEFGLSLMPFLPSLARVDFRKNLEQLDLPAPIRRALLVHKGKLTPGYEYIERFVKERG